MPQYTLPFSQTPRYHEVDFIVSGCNRTAFELVGSWPDWAALLLVGPKGSGKTHLGHVWAVRAKASIIPAARLDPQTITTHCLIEDIAQAEPETLFHAINMGKENRVSLLLTAERPAKQLGFTLPDLTSRLAAMPVASIGAPDDTALAGVLRKQFADRQIDAPTEVVEYLLARTERSFAAVTAWVEYLDSAMWREKRNLTVAFVRDVLAHTPVKTPADRA
ncbi:MAG: DnaA/Hda family protein [Alphaproteobacteria bacterium]